MRQVCAFEICTREVHVLEIGTSKARSFEVRAGPTAYEHRAALETVCTGLARQRPPQQLVSVVSQCPIATVVGWPP